MLCEIAENNQSELPEHVSPYTEHSCGKTVAIPKEMVSILQDGKMDLSKLLEKDPYASLEEEVWGMFERELFDVIVYAGTMSEKLATMVSQRKVSDVDVRGCRDIGSVKDRDVVLMFDRLSSGECVLKAIRALEGNGCRVIRIGFVVEDTTAGARKRKVLRGYPFEAVITLP